LSLSDTPSCNHYYQYHHTYKSLARAAMDIHWHSDQVSLRKGVPLENISCLEFVDRRNTVNVILTRQTYGQRSSLCVPDILGALAGWRQNMQKKKRSRASNCQVLNTSVLGKFSNKKIAALMARFQNFANGAAKKQPHSAQFFENHPLHGLN